jgi:outer membrane receptor protein involved in Fe transport
LTYAVNRFTFGTTATYDPAKYFSTRLTLGMDYRKNEERQFIPIAAEAVTGVPGGALGRSDREFLTLTLDYAGTVKYPQSGKITSAFTFGAQGFRQEDRESSVTATEFGLPGTDDFDNAANLAPLESNRQIFSGGFFFNEQVGLWNKLFVNAGVRIDGNTAFGDAVNLATYPKFGVAYNISDEAFWQRLPWSGVWHQLKLRGSWGQTGSFPAPFTKDKTFVQGAYLDGVAANFGNPGDENLGPEKTRTVEMGFDAALLSERVGLELNAFRSRTVDALLTVPSDPATGLGFQLRNVGTIKNSGIELGLNASILNTRNVRFSLRGSYSTLTNKVESLGGAQPFSLAGFGFLPQRVEAGKPVGVFQTTRPNDDPATPQHEFDTVLERSPLADKYFSLGANLTLWRNLQLSILGDGQTGGYVLNTGAVLRYFNGGEPEASLVPPGYDFDTASEVFVEKGDFFKIREITASYRLPQNYFGTQWRLIASLRNVATFAKAKRMDPELQGFRDGSATNTDVGGINFFTLPPPHQFRFALEAEL